MFSNVMSRACSAVHRTEFGLHVAIVSIGLAGVRRCLAASSVAPAQVGPTSSEPLIPATMRVASDDYRAGAPRHSDLHAAKLTIRPTLRLTTMQQTLPPMAVKPTGDLSSLVAQLRGTDPGSRELECLAVGIYFESKSEPLAGQLAVGQVIANRANSRPFPVVPIAACCSSAASSASSAAIPAGGARARAGSGRTRSRSPRSSTRICKDSAVGNALFFHAKPRLAALAPEARRVGRQSHLLPLGRFLDILRFVLGWPAMATLSRFVLRRRAADCRRGRARSDPPVLPAGPVRNLRSAAAQRPARGHDGDRRQGRD